MDPIADSLTRILGGDEYVEIADVPIYGEQETRDKNGAVISRVTKEDLEEIVRNCQTREANGCLAILGPGHTLDGDVPEVHQPPPWGAVGKWAVKYYDSLKKHCISCSYFVKKKFREAVNTFPHRSVEVWKNAKYIERVALLRQAPHHELGLLMFAKKDDTLLRYAGDPTDPPNADDPDPADVDRFMKCAKKCYPHLHDMHEKHAAALSATNGFIPSDGRDKMSATATPPVNDELERYKKETGDTLEKLKAENVALRERGDKLEKVGNELSAKLVTMERKEKYSAELQAIQNEHDLEFDLAEELNDCVEMGPEQFEKHKKRVLKYAKREHPPTDTFVQLHRGSVEGGKDQPKELTEAELDTALKFQRSNHCTWDEALEKSGVRPKKTA